MKPRRIAVCLSGQSRTWKVAFPSIRSFFNSSMHQVNFFGHTWDQNFWRVNKKGFENVVEVMSREKLYEELNRDIVFSKLQISPQVTPFLVNDSYLTWAGMLKSASLAMNLKTLYEAENDMRFDYVFHCRWDVAYKPNGSVDNLITRAFLPDSIHVNRWFFPYEYRFPAIDDIFYFGSSRSMDILDGFWHYYKSGRFFSMHDFHATRNPALDKVGAGVLLYKWANMKNLKMVDLNPLDLGIAVVRKDAQNCKWPDDYQTIMKAYRNYLS